MVIVTNGFYVIPYKKTEDIFNIFQDINASILSE